MYYKEKMLLCKQAEKGTDTEPLEQVQYDTEYNVFANEKQHSEQLESISNTCVVEKVDSIVIPDSPDICDNVIQTDQNVKEYDDKRVVLANLIANLKVDIDEDKKIQKQLKKANASMTQELKGCKSILAETSMTLGESNSIRDSCLIALQSKQAEFETYKTLNDLTVDYDKLERKLNKTIGLLAQKEIDIKEGLKLKAYEISVVKEKQDELVKKSLLTKSHYEGLVKEKINVITDLKLKEEKDIDKMISMEKQLKFLKEIIYQKESINSNHSYIPYDPSDLANRFTPDREETLTLEKESRSKMNKDLVKPYDYIKQNSLYEIFKPAIQEYHDQLAHANEIIDESQVLLKVPRKNNMYSVDLKNIVPKGGLTCLFAKATSDESKLWHRRLGHLNFKTMNNLVKGNLVRGLPSKLFENDQTYVVCQKGKQHKASSRTPQQNGVVERRNRTLIEAARTMLTDSKLPTTFWAEAVNIACYVSFTILNTIDHLGKFDDKADEGFFVGYSLNSKACRVFNSRTKIVDENLHIRFSESTPNVVVLIIWTKPSMDDEAKIRVDEDLRKESECNDQENEDNVNNTNNVNAASTNEVNTVGGKISIELPLDLNMPTLEDYSIFDSSKNDEDDDAVADMNNLDTTIQEEPKKVIHALKDPSWIEAMQEELLQFKLTQRLELWILPNVKGLSGKYFVVHQMDVSNALLIWEDIEEHKRAVLERAYTDRDYVGASLDRKFTTGGYQFLGCRLTSWQCKKPTVVANSITKAEYVAASSCWQNENVVEEVVDAAQVSTAATTVTITTEEITLAQALMEIKSTKPKEKGVVIQELGESTTTISSQLSSQQSLDKGKGILIEPMKPMEKKDLIRLDEEAALKL
ncbi:integrase, catalytic region, zinc finger, CCHC-type containing protein [Tanacetum coccineum]